MRARTVPSSRRTSGRSLRWLRRCNERSAAKYQAGYLSRLRMARNHSGGDAMSAVRPLLHALSALDVAPLDTREPLECRDCRAHLDECLCEQVVPVSCRKCWELETACECDVELDDIDAVNLRQEDESESQHSARLYGDGR
jgi:hypothetical protein